MLALLCIPLLGGVALILMGRRVAGAVAILLGIAGFTGLIAIMSSDDAMTEQQDV